MSGKKRKILAGIGALMICAAVIFGAWNLHQRAGTGTGPEPEKVTAEDKRQELQDYKGLYAEDSIVLNNVTEETAKVLAEKAGARYRMTQKGDYAVLYLPEGTSIEDVYSDEDMEAFLPEMSPDYYAHVYSQDAAGNVLTASRPNYEVSDSLYDQQSYLDYLNLSDTWNVSKGENITVAIIDTGIDTDHPEFTGRISELSYNASEDKVVKDYGLEVIEDEAGHGTQVAGVLAAGMGNDGITGIAPNVNLLIIKCECDEVGQFVRSSDLVFGLAYAIERDADVVNMSFGTEFDIFSKYTKLAVDSDILCVAAAGNEGSSLPVYPAADPCVIGVGSMDQGSWSLAAYSNYGDNADLLAPGTAFSADVGGGYAFSTGTSVSCPIVAGAAALYLSQNPQTEFEAMEELLQASSIDLGPLGEDWENGFGLLDVYALVCMEKGTLTYDMLTEELGNETQLFVRGRTLQRMPEPERDNVVLDGWFYDTEQADECAYFTDIFTQDVTLYAGWINEDEGTAYVYTTLPDGTIEISSYTGRRRYLTVPQTIEGKQVSSIGEYAFADNGRIRSISLPETLTSIGQYAFSNASYLRNVDIPETVAFIGEDAFCGCSALTQVNIRQNSRLQSVGKEAFAYSGLQSFTVPATLESIGDDAFFGCRSLRSFSVSEGNSRFTSRGDALYDSGGSTLLCCPAGLSGTYTVPEDTKEVGRHAFAYTRSREIVLPEGIEVLGEGAFLNASIRKLTIPGSVTGLGDSLCGYCHDLSDITLEEGQYSSIPAECFTGCYNLKSIEIPEQIRVINSSAFSFGGIRRVSFRGTGRLEEIGANTFESTPLEEITIPSSVSRIGASAFESCNSLRNVAFAENSACSAIAEKAFAGCLALKSVELPDALAVLDKQAFYDSGLESVTVGAGLTSLGEGTFSGCTSLQAINVADGNPRYSSFDGVVYNKDQSVLLMVPGARTGAYTLPDTVKSIGPYAFAGAEKITEVYLNEGLTGIEDYAFYQCSGLVSQSMPATLQEIGAGAFMACTGMQTIFLPDSLTTIGEQAFSQCTSLADPVTIPASLVSIGRYAFFNDYNLRSITVAADSSLSRIGNATFAGCGISDFTVPDTVSTMGQEVFSGCRNLVAVTFEGDNLLTDLAAWTFSGADNLRQITFEEGSHLTNIEARACEGLPRLERISLEYCTALDNIDNYAFLNCASLSEISLPNSLTQIGRYAFNRCSSLTELRVPSSVDFIGRYAFAGTGGLSVYFRSATLPAHLQENWDYGINGYYMGVSGTRTSGDWTYALTEDDKASIVAYNGSAAEIELDTIDGYEVVSIGAGAFKDNSTLQRITLPDTLTGIYAAAFKGTSNLQNITIPASVTTIDNEAFMDSGISGITFADGSGLSVLGRYAFANTANLQQAAVPDGVEKLRDHIFYKSAVSTVTFGENSALREIGRHAFASSALTTIALPDTLEKIDYNAFRETASLTGIDFGDPASLMIYGEAFYRSGLQNVTIPVGVSYLGEFCFTASPDLTSISVDPDNEAYCSIDGVLFNKAATRLITCPAGKTGSYDIANTVTTLAFAAFEGSRLSEINIPADSQLFSIGYRAFYDCDNLESINVPASVVSLESYSFAGCDKLKTVVVSSDSRMGGIYKCAFYNDAALTDINIPDSVQEIGESAFYGCSSMSNVQVNETSQLQTIADHAFEYAGIGSFVMPAKVTELGAYAFRGTALKTFTFNEALVEIGDFALAGAGLTEQEELVVPYSVNYIGKGFIQGNTSIKSLTVPFVGESADHTSSYQTGGHQYGGLEYFYYDLNSITENEKALEYVKLTKTEVVPDKAFESMTALKTVSLPETVVEIRYAAFFDCSSLSNVNLPDSIKRIGTLAFEYCSNLKMDSLPESIAYIEQSAFSKSGISIHEIPAGTLHIGYEAFLECGNILEIFIPDSVQEIGGGAFSGDSNLTAINVDANNQFYCSVDGILYDKQKTRILSVPAKISGDIEVPAGIQEIQAYAFYKCGNITNIALPDTLKKIESAAFMECTALEKITIPASVEEVGNGILGYCSSLRELYIEASLTELYSMFANCPSLEIITLPEGLTEISFRGCSSLKQIVLSDTVETVYLEGCGSLEYIYLGKSLKTIGWPGFSGCYLLSNIEVSSSNSVYEAKDGILYNKKSKSIVFVPKSIEGAVSVIDGVELIETGAFEGCINMTELTLPESVKRIGEYAFRNCTALSEINLGGGIEFIEKDAFKYTAYSENESNYEDGVLYVGEYLISSDSEKKDITIREGTRLIACEAFYDNQYLESVQFPDSLRYINGNAFSYCPIKALKFNSGLKRISYSPFYRVSLNALELSCDEIYGDSLGTVDEQFVWIRKDIDLENFSLSFGFDTEQGKVLRIPDLGMFEEHGVYGKFEDVIIDNPDKTLGGLEAERVFVNQTEGEAGGFSWWDESVPVYYRGEWNCAVFYVNGYFCKMQALKTGDMVEEPSSAMINNYLRDGQSFIGWDINGDGKADSLPATLTEDLEATAILDTPITGISMDETAQLEVDSTKTLSIVYEPVYNNGNEAVTWASSNEAVATVDENGLITGVSEGVTIITATLAGDDQINAACELTVVPSRFGIKLENTEGSLLKGKTMTLVPEINLPEGNESPVEWTSTEPSVATVEDGLITAVSGGNTDIIITCGRYSAVFKLSVISPMTGIRISDPVTQMNVGQTYSLKLAFEPSDITDSKTAVFTSGDESVATVNQEGIVTAAGPGQVTITAAVGEYSASVDIEVLAPLQWIRLNTNSGTMRIARTKQMEVIYEPSNTTEDRTVTWESSDPDVATIDSNGKVTAVSKGSAVITGTVGRLKDTYTVTVVGLRDDSSGIIVTNKDNTEMPDQLSLVVENMGQTDPERTEGLVEDLQSFTEEPVTAEIYDISLISGTDTVQPDTAVDVEIPILGSLEHENVSVYCAEEDGSFTDMNAEKSGDYLTFTTEHFSVYAVSVKHDFEEYVYNNDATCEEDGTETAQCTHPGCPETHTRTAEGTAAGHSWDEGTVAQEPSCTEAGLVVYTCRNDSEHVRTEETKPLGHNMEHAEYRAESCEEAGSVEYWYCPRCEKYYLDEEGVNEITFEETVIPPAGHAYGEWTVSREATCKENGTKLRTCTACGNQETEEIPMTEHAWEEDFRVDLEPSCMENGQKSIHCAVCDATKDETVIPAAGHSFGEWETVEPASCEGAGSEKRVCEVCGYVETVSLDPTGHVWAEDYTIDKEPACTEEGSESIHCTVCGEIREDSVRTIDKTGHAYGDWVVSKEATCTETGIRLRICTACGNQETEEIPMTEHAWEEDFRVDLEPSCMENGQKSIHCAVCDATKDETVIPAAGHSFGPWETVESASCEGAGSEKRVCTTCGYMETNGLDPTGHTWNEDYTIDKEPTCTEAGSRSVHCMNCDAVKDSEMIPAPGHSFGAWETVEVSTCEEPGSEKRKCEICGTEETHAVAPTGHLHTEIRGKTSPSCTQEGYSGDLYCIDCGKLLQTGSALEAAGHSWKETYTTDIEASCENEGQRSIHCTVCGEIREDSKETIPALGHTWGPWTEVKAPGCTSEGEETRTCLRDENHKESRGIAATGHTFTHIEPKAPTEEETGNIEYWFCALCGKSFRDTEGKEEITVSDTIIPKYENVGIAEITGINDLSYTGEALMPVPILTIHGRQLEKDIDYTLSYSDNVNAGTASVTITGTGSYVGTTVRTFRIIPQNITPTVTLSATTYTYDGKEKKPAVTVSDGTGPFPDGSYSVTWTDGRKNAGTYYVTVTMQGNYSGSKAVPFTIKRAAQKVTAKAAATPIAVGRTTGISVSGTKESPDLTYKSSDTSIATVTTAGKITAKKVGTARITVKAAATTNYAARSVTVTVKVVPAATSSVTATNLAKGIKVTWKKVTGASGYLIYRNGKAIKTIKSGNTVTFTDTAANTNATKYIYKVVAKAATGNSTLSKSTTIWRITQPSVISAVNNASRKVTVKWAKNTKATGYQIQYSANKNFSSGNKAVAITKAATVSKVISGLIKGKTYYIRIRTYKTVGSTKYWSAWSTPKTVKIGR